MTGVVSTLASWLAVSVIAACVWMVVRRWYRRRWLSLERHIESALLQANGCACGQPTRRAVHGRRRCIPILGCQCRGFETAEVMVHRADRCIPAREAVR